MKKESVKINKKLYKEKSLSIIQEGIEIDNNVYLNTYDYDIKKIIDLPIKDVMIFDKEETVKNEPDDHYYKEYVDSLKQELYKNPNGFHLLNKDFLYGDWWRLKENNNLYFISISTPYIFKTDNNYEIRNIMKRAFEIFHKNDELNNNLYFKRIYKNGKRTSFFSLEQKYNIENTNDKIEKFIDNNVNSNNENINYYKDILIKINEKNILLDKIIFNIEKTSNNKIKDFAIYDLDIIIPFNLNINYKELFLFVIEKIKNKDKNYLKDKKELIKYSENAIDEYLINLDENKIIFLNNFKDKLHNQKTCINQTCQMKLKRKLKRKK